MCHPVDFTSHQLVLQKHICEGEIDALHRARGLASLLNEHFTTARIIFPIHGLHAIFLIIIGSLFVLSVELQVEMIHLVFQALDASL
mmetsp:Transcript_33184/g.104951  ORF Transcript_33184/g.104951 Transcript_33184/m.104951 type:complete len:87 (-) Transcript_33184:946-1206(-)